MNAAYKQLRDKEETATNTSKFDLRRAVRLENFNADKIYQFFGVGNANNRNSVPWKTSYGISNMTNGIDDVEDRLTGASFVGAYPGVITNNAGLTKMTLQNDATATVAGVNAVWTNQGANLLQPITLVYKIKVHNKWNMGQAATIGEVEKLVYIVVNPTN